MKTKRSYTIEQIAQSEEMTNLFRNRYRSNYTFIYENYDELYEMEVALDKAEQLRSEIYEHVAHMLRDDIPVSDRELRALAFTLREFGAIEF